MRTPSSFLRESLRSSPGHPQSVCPIREERDYVSTISGYSSAGTPHRGIGDLLQMMCSQLAPQEMTCLWTSTR